MNGFMSKVSLMVTDDDWRRSDPKYRSCCGRLDSVKAAALVAAAETLGICFLIISAVVSASRLDLNGEYYYSRLLLISIYVVDSVALTVAVLSLVAGLRRRLPKLLIVHMVKDLLALALSLVLTPVLIYCLCTLGAVATTVHSDAGALDDLVRPVAETKTAVSSAGRLLVVAFVLNLGFICVQIWTFSVVLSAYRALKDDERSRDWHAAPYRV